MFLSSTRDRSIPRYTVSNVRPPARLVVRSSRVRRTISLDSSRSRDWHSPVPAVYCAVLFVRFYSRRVLFSDVRGDTALVSLHARPATTTTTSRRRSAVIVISPCALYVVIFYSIILCTAARVVIISTTSDRAFPTYNDYGRVERRLRAVQECAQRPYDHADDLYQRAAFRLFHVVRLVAGQRSTSQTKSASCPFPSAYADDSQSG